MFVHRVRPRVVALSCVCFVSIVAVAAATTHGARTPGVGTSRASGAVPTTASNRRAAVLDARKLLAGVVAPAGAVLRSSGAGTGTRAPLLTTAFASAVAYRTWTVGSDPGSVLSFVEAHLPPGSIVLSTGSGGGSRSVIRSWPAVEGILDVRWLEIAVSSRAGGTRLYAESQSQWIVTRPVGERIPPGVRQVDVSSGWPGKRPFVSRTVHARATVGRLVRLFDSLRIVQPGAINCPAEVATPMVAVVFRAGGTRRVLASAAVPANANFSWSTDLPGWACFSIQFSVRGRARTPLIGNVISPIQRLLHLKLAP